MYGGINTPPKIFRSEIQTSESEIQRQNADKEKGRNMAEIYRVFCIGFVLLAFYARNEAFTLFTVIFTAPYWFEWICRKIGVK